MRLLSPILFSVVCGLSLSGCLELIRRPEQASFPDAPSPAGNRSPAAEVERDSAAVFRLPSSPPRERPRSRREKIEQVNKYALWCIEHGMWNEARSHMEQALRQDSLSASLHNNLGIVYEHLGLHGKAADAYRRALALDPDNEIYRLNLRRLERFQKVGRDTSAQIDIFDSRRSRKKGLGSSFQDQNERTFFTGE